MQTALKLKSKTWVQEPFAPDLLLYIEKSHHFSRTMVIHGHQSKPPQCCIVGLDRLELFFFLIDICPEVIILSLGAYLSDSPILVDLGIWPFSFKLQKSVPGQVR